MQKNTLAIALGLTASVSLIGCGGDSTDSPTTTPNKTYSVKAIDGYLNGAQVWLDLNGNFKLDDGEPSATSGAGGRATLNVNDVDDPASFSVVVRAIKGQTVDEDTGNLVASNFVMSAPAGQQNVTPLSTLVHVKLASDSTLTLEEAVTSVATQLGIDQQAVLSDYKQEENSQASFGARNLVSSGSLPETPEALETAANDTDGTNELLDNAEAISATIKQIIEDPEQQGDLDSIVINKSGEPDSDSDGDGVADADDFAPDDNTEWVDSDQDGIGDNADKDDDNDGTLDEDDAFPFDATETIDTDQDGIGNNADSDDDNDGVADDDDAFPLDKTESVDTDGDKIGNNADTDDDGDGTPDVDDAFPLDDSEDTDTDGDGTGNNADTDDDGDGVEDDSDVDPLDPEVSLPDNAATINFLTGNATLYSFNFDENDGVKSLYQETFTANGDVTTLSKIERIRADKVGISLPLDVIEDIQLGDSGWEETGTIYSYSVANHIIKAYPNDLPQRTYTLSGVVVDLAGKLISESGLEWQSFTDEQATFPQGAKLAKFNATPDRDHYTLWKEWRPWVYRGGVENDTLGATTLDELITNSSIGSNGSASALVGVSVGWDAAVELVSDHTANYYTMDWTNDKAVLVASASWSRQTVNGEDILRYTVPETAINQWGEKFDNENSSMILSAYQGQVYFGNYEQQGQLITDDSLVLLNMTARDTILSAVELTVSQCDFSDKDSNATMSDFTSAIAVCGGSSAITAEMVAGQTFHRVRGDGSTRDYYFNPNGELVVTKGDGSSYSQQWSITNGQVLIEETDPTTGDFIKWYWALLDKDDSDWSLKFFEQEKFEGVESSIVWSDTVSLSSECLFPEAMGKTVDDFKNQVADYAACNDNFEPMLAQNVEGSAPFRVNSRGETRAYYFAADGTVSYYRNGVENRLNWEVDAEGLLTLSTQGYYETWALLSESGGNLSIGRFDSDTGEIWVAHMVETEQWPMPAECTVNETEWDDVNERPVSYGYLAEFEQAVSQCQSDSGSKAKFSTDFFDQLSVTLLGQGDDTEEYTLNADGSGSYSDGEASYPTTWTVNDATGVLTFILQDGGTTWKDRFAIVDTDGVSFSIKAMSQSTEWDGVSDTSGADIWSARFTISD